LLAGERFETLLETMATEQLVSLVVTGGSRFDPEAVHRDGGIGRFGISLGTGVRPHFEEERVPTIMAWFEARREGASGVLDRWSARFDSEMQSGRGIQGAITRGSWQPHGDTTAYETACGMAPGVGTLREWVTRRLRVPGTHRTWLSCALAAHLSDRGSLDAIAEVTPLGDALRITLRDRAHYAELERALAGVLPTASESQAVTRAFAARHRA
jgi:hypothetical protein